jgi:hypothetical protein
MIIAAAAAASSETGILLMIRVICNCCAEAGIFS